MKHAKFLSLDGVDGAGKSTQCRLLAEWLRARNLPIVECTDPGGTPVGGELRQLLLGHRYELSLECEALLFMASRAQLVAKVIRPALDAGQTVVCDRFLLANVVYQGHAGELDIAELCHVGRFATAGLEPDLTIVLDLPVESARVRQINPPDRMESRDASYHGRVRAGFLAEAKRRPDRIRVVDAIQSVDAVHQQICAEVLRVLEANPRT